jgi:LysM domain-containing protein
MAAVMVDDTHELAPYVAPTAPRTKPWVFWRRRLVAVGLGVLALTVVAPRFRAALGGAPASAPEGVPVPISYVVEPGDTLWSIARRVQPVGDPRALVARLEVVAGGAEVRPGQVLILSS